MNATRAFGLAITAWAVAMTVAHADTPKVEKEDGHLSPVLAEVTFLDKSKRKVMVYGVGGDPDKGRGYYRHVFQAKGKDGANVRVWLDTIDVLKEATEKKAVAVMKDGTERELNHSNQVLYYSTPDDAKEHVALARVKEVKFLKAARKDKSGKAMFDQWLYSPYTGEKLPPVE